MDALLKNSSEFFDSQTSQTTRSSLKKKSFEFFIREILLEKTIKVKDIPANLEELETDYRTALDELEHLFIGGSLSKDAVLFLKEFYDHF